MLCSEVKIAADNLPVSLQEEILSFSGRHQAMFRPFLLIRAYVDTDREVTVSLRWTVDTIQRRFRLGILQGPVARYLSFTVFHWYSNISKKPFPDLGINLGVLQLLPSRVRYVRRTTHGVIDRACR